MKIVLRGTFDEKRKQLNDALGIDHDEQTKQIDLFRKSLLKNIEALYIDENGKFHKLEDNEKQI